MTTFDPHHTQYFLASTLKAIIPTKVTNITHGDTSSEVITRISHIKELVQTLFLAQDDILNFYKDKIAREAHQYKFFDLSLKLISNSIAYIG